MQSLDPKAGLEHKEIAKGGSFYLLKQNSNMKNKKTKPNTSNWEMTNNTLRNKKSEN